MGTQPSKLHSQVAPGGEDDRLRRSVFKPHFPSGAGGGGSGGISSGRQQQQHDSPTRELQQHHHQQQQTKSYQYRHDRGNIKPGGGGGCGSGLSWFGSCNSGGGRTGLGRFRGCDGSCVTVTVWCSCLHVWLQNVPVLFRKGRRRFLQVLPDPRH